MPMIGYKRARNLGKHLIQAQLYLAQEKEIVSFNAVL